MQLIPFAKLTSFFTEHLKGAGNRLQPTIEQADTETIAIGPLVGSEHASVALLSGWAILDRLHLLRGLVSFLWRD